MSDARNDRVAPYRREARQFVGDLRQDTHRLERSRGVPVAAFVERVAGDAARMVQKWPIREGRHRFLVELAGEVRSEWRVQPEPDGLRAQLYEALADRLSEMARAELG